MAWLRLDDGYYRHPKIVRAGRDARDLDVAGMLYAAANLTDGYLPAEVLPQLAADAGVARPKQLVARLLEVRRWEPAEGGWVVHDFLDFNPSKEEVESNRDRVNQWRATKKGDAKPTTRRAKAAQNGAGGALHAAHVTAQNAPKNGRAGALHAASPSPTPSPVDTLEPPVDQPETGTARARPRPEESEEVELEQDGREPIQILQRLAYEVADRLGVSRERRPVWVDLSELYRDSGLDPPTFELRAERALAQVRRRKSDDRRGQFVAALKQILEV